MASEDYFEHVGPGGETPLMRMRATGYLSSSHDSYEVGENIGWGTLWEGTPRAVVAAWMASPPHRANILDARFHDTRRRRLRAPAVPPGPQPAGRHLHRRTSAPSSPAEAAVE